MSSNSHIHISKCVSLALHFFIVLSVYFSPLFTTWLLGRPHAVDLLAGCVHCVCFRSGSMHNLVFTLHKCRLYQLLSVSLASQHLSMNTAASKKQASNCVCRLSLF